MRHFTLQRLTQNDYATYGQLSDEENRLVCCIVEKPWLDNHPDTSCIPAGTYAAHRRAANDTRHGYEVFELDGVPGREHIQIHIANLPSELLGCLATGMHFGEVTNTHGDSGYGALESSAAFTKFMNLNAGEQNLTLTVVDVVPVAA